MVTLYRIRLYGDIFVNVWKMGGGGAIAEPHFETTEVHIGDNSM